MAIKEFMAIIEQKFNMLDWNLFLVNLIIAIILIAIGIFIGRLITFLFKKCIEKGKVEGYVKKSFLDLVATLLRWSIYLIFVNLALMKLNAPQLTNWLSSIIIILPALVGSLLLIIVGFAIATYLKHIVKEMKLENGELLSQVFFYFILYSFIILAFKTIMVNQDKTFVNNLIIILSGVVGLMFIFLKFKDKPERQKKKGLKN